MPVTIASGSVFQTKVGTQHILTRINSSGVFVFTSDCTSMIVGDTLHLVAYSVVLSGQTLQRQYEAYYANSQYIPIKTIHVVTPIQAEFAVNVTSSGAQGSGTGSNGPVIAWHVAQVN